jgi:hypothetical protein
LPESKSLAVVLKALGVCEQTYYRWRKAYGQLSPDEARRLLASWRARTAA